MSFVVLIAVAIAIPVSAVAFFWIVSRADESGVAALPRWKRVSVIAVTTAPSILIGALVVWLAINWWSAEFAAPALATILLLVGLAVGPVFSAIKQTRPAQAERIMTMRHVVQGGVYVLSGVCWAVASLTHDWWLVLAAIGSASLGGIQLFMATGRELGT